LGWGNIGMKATNEHTKLQKSLNLKTFDIHTNIDGGRFNRMVETRHALSLQHRAGGSYGKSDAVLDIKQNGKTLASITRDAINGLIHRCYGFYQDYIVSGGSHGQLKIYNFQGREVANLVGHTGEVWSIALDGDRLVSGSSDQTIRVWNLNELKMKNEKLKINEKYISSIMKQHNISRESVLKQAEKMNDTKIYSNFPTLHPQLNIFVSKDNEWIVWTPEGFYNASKGAEQYIGYHINRGANKEAEFLDVSRFRKQFYRPDLIAKAVAGEDISHYARGINIDTLLNRGLPPKVEILSDSHTINTDSTPIGVKVCNQGGGVANLSFYLDGKPIEYQKNTKAFQHRKEQGGGCTTIEQRITIPSGVHTIGFNATNQEGDILSNKPTITVTNNQKVTKKPNLHLLTLSINDYRDDELDLKFPNNDADKLSQKLQTIGKPVFESVYSYALKDSQVTQQGIKTKVAQIAPKIGANDVFILYISGHGVTNDADGDYYFIPYDCPNGADVTKRAINQQRFKEIMSQVKAVKSVIFLDTCESGSMASKDLVNTSVNRFGGNVGSAIIAGATSSQNAIDGYKEHGIFTYTLLDAMSNNKVYSFDDKLSINEVAEYTKYLLPKLAKEKFNHEQKPTIYLNGDTTFAIGGI